MESVLAVDIDAAQGVDELHKCSKVHSYIGMDRLIEDVRHRIAQQPGPFARIASLITDLMREIEAMSAIARYVDPEIARHGYDRPTFRGRIEAHEKQRVGEVVMLWLGFDAD